MNTPGTPSILDRTMFNRAVLAVNALADQVYASDINRKLDLAGVYSNVAIAEAINNLAVAIARVFGQPDQQNGDDR